MAAALTSSFLFHPHHKHYSITASRWVSSPRNTSTHHLIICSASAAAGGSNLGSDENPYQVLGVNPIEGFDKVKVAYTRKKRDAEKRGDAESLAKLERAYDKVMMAQLSNRKKGVTFGSLDVSKDIKFADKLPIVPWAPRFSRSSIKDIRINMGISVIFTIWNIAQRQAEWKPLQFLGFTFLYRIFEKLKAHEPATTPIYTEDGEVYEDEGRTARMGKRLLRSLFLVLGCMAAASLGYTGILNLIEFLGQYIPRYLINNQELFVTTASAILLFFMVSYYR